MNRLVVFISILLLPLIAMAELSVEQLNKVVASPEQLHGEFKQSKYLKDLDVTLDSSGVFSYTRAESIRWETLEPIKNLLLMTPERISSSHNGQETMMLEAKSNPTVMILSDVFFAVLTANWGKLTTYFSLSGTLNQQQWHVDLIPTDAAIMQAIRRVEIEGDSLLKQLVFVESNGNRTVIIFDQLTQ